MMYSYVVNHDGGSAPNPFYGFCTLAICKPLIRKKAKVGDWIIGTGNKRVGNDILIYAMKVTEVLSFDEYYNDYRFDKKKPNHGSREKYARLGDNIYKPVKNGFKQLRSVHSNGRLEDQRYKKHDLSGKNALISDYFYYFGNKKVELPLDLRVIIKKGQGHKSINIPTKARTRFVEFIRKKRKGRSGVPNDQGKVSGDCKFFDECCEK